MNICLINDTTSCHAGSKKVMDNIRGYLKDHEIVGTIPVSVGGSINKRLIDKCDVVVVNAEGSIHHNAPWGITILEALEYAQKRGKGTYLLNTLYQCMDKRFNGIVANCDVVIARELYSYQNLYKINNKTEVHPDFCVLNPKHSYQVIGVKGDICKTQTHFASIYKNALDLNYPVCSISNKYSFDTYVETYKSKSIVLTGQHHAVYAAMLAETPFVPTFGNSFKIESFVEWLDIPVMMCATPKQVTQEINKIKNGEYTEGFNSAFMRLKEMTNILDKRMEELFNV